MNGSAATELYALQSINSALVIFNTGLKDK
jgi:hypothetical protein